MKNKFLIIDNGSTKALNLRKKIESLVPSDWEYNENDYEYVLVIGGDGTFLRNKNMYYDKKVVAINGGNLGYYSYFDSKNLKSIFSKINNDNLFFSPLEIFVETNNNSYSCINELLIRSNKVLNANVFINNVLLEKFKGTGLMICTPLGSTAHAKNAGGAILDPNLDIIQFIEIEPLTQKKYSSLKSPLVLKFDNKIVLKSKSNSNNFIILDGETIEEKFDNNLSISFNYAKFKLFKPDCKKRYLKKLRDSFVEDK